MIGKTLRYGMLMIIPLCVLVFFTGNFSVDLFPKERLNSAHEKWNSHQSASYQMQVRIVSGMGTGFADLPLGDFQITVKDGTVIAAGESNWLGAAGDPPIPYRPTHSLSPGKSLPMDHLFDYAPQQLAPLSDINIYTCGQNRVESEYNATQGYVSRLQSTCSGGWLGCGVSDCNASLVVQNLKPLAP